MSVCSGRKCGPVVGMRGGMQRAFFNFQDKSAVPFKIAQCVPLALQSLSKHGSPNIDCGSCPLLLLSASPSSTRLCTLYFDAFVRLLCINQSN
jgi:hypothetical protein